MKESRGERLHLLFAGLDRPRARLRRYAAAVLLVGAVALAADLLRPHLEGAAFLLFFVAVTSVAWYAGTGPALVATVLSVVAADFLLLGTHGSFHLQEETDLIALVVFALLSVGVASAARLAREGLRSTRLLADVSRSLAAARGVEDGLRELARVACPHLADYCVTYTLEEDGSARRVGASHADPDCEDLARGLLDLRPPPVADEYAVGGVLRSGEPLLMRRIPPELADETVQEPRHLELLRRLEPLSIMILPLRARGHTLGAIAFVTTSRSRRRYGEEDLPLAGDVADRAALALDNVRLLDRAEREVEQRRRVEAELRRREERFRTLAENAPDLIARLDRRHRHLYVNPAVERLTGVSRDRFLGRTNRELGIGPGVTGEAEDVDAVFRTGEARALEFPVATERGTRWVSARIVPERDAAGRVTSVLCVARDTTERKVAEERNVLLVEAGLLVTSSLDPDEILPGFVRLLAGRVADWCIVDTLAADGTPARPELAAAEPEVEDTLRELRRRYPPALQAGIHPIGRVLATGRPQLAAAPDPGLLERLARDPDHLRLLTEVGVGSFMVVPLTARDRTIGALTLGSHPGGRVYGPEDLALARQLALALGLGLDNARLFREAEESARLREEVLAVVAHDLRNPLHVIGTATELLSRVRDPEETERYRRMMRRAMRQATRLIRDLLDVSRIEAGGFRVRRARVHPRALLEELAEAYRERARERGVALRPRLEDGCGPMRADRVRILQAVGNLLDNAIAISPPGGTVGLSVERRAGEVVFSVSDEGPGVPAEQVEHLFEAFWSGRRDAPGAGLGLAIVRGVAEAHGGRAWVRTGGEAGSVFSFSIPDPGPVADGA